jgi:hypothetical protein
MELDNTKRYDVVIVEIATGKVDTVLHTNTTARLAERSMDTWACRVNDNYYVDIREHKEYKAEMEGAEN